MGGVHVDSHIDIRPHLVQGRVDDETCVADGMWSRFLDFSLRVDEDQVRDLYKAEVNSVRVYTEDILAAGHDIILLPEKKQHTDPEELRVQGVFSYSRQP